MNGPQPGWYPDPANPAQQRYWNGTGWALATPPTSVAGVFGRVFAYMLAVGVLTGIISGTVGMPIFGTIFGLIAGIAIGIGVGLIAGAVIAFAARPSVAPKTYRLCIDVTLVVLYIATAALAIVWINQKALVGPRPAYTMLVVVLIAFIAVRPRFRRLVPTQATP
ncbi:DUF2510 domain-containing protein [Mycobacterium sp. NPDC051804]|uniref:DUF2510 domain-containing protein n=1 Tax=Mycobacterium sp. NPDC051804 TaxID=3364295 RepID=UPI0037A807EA